MKVLFAFLRFCCIMEAVILMPKDKNIHSGHRDRVRERFCETGLDSFADHNVLELVLFYSVPRRDTNELAHRLIKHFGSLPAVFEASVERLMEVPGISYNSAVLIRLFTEVGKRYAMSKQKKGVVLDDMETAANYVSGLFIGDSVESFYIICLDGRNKVICCEKHSSGTATNSSVTIPFVIDSVTKHKARSVILAHNHPASYARPSYEDVDITRRIKRLLDEMHIHLIDHIIVGYDGKCVSMSASRMMSEDYGVN